MYGMWDVAGSLIGRVVVGFEVGVRVSLLAHSQAKR